MNLEKSILRALDQINARGLIRFYAFAKTGSFRAASELLGCSEKGIYEATRVLKETLDVRLYTAKRYSDLTEAGEHLAGMLTTIFEDLDNAIQQTKELK